MEFEGTRQQKPLLHPPAEQLEAYKQPREALIREIIETILLTLFIFWIVNSATGRYRIEGSSMLPTLKEGEYIIIDQLSYYLDEPKRGEIIVLDFPNDRSRRFIKRIVGLPGDHIEIGDGSVMINGVELDEPYINNSPNYDGNWDVPEDQYFVLGDNRNNSHDSKNWEYLPRDDIVGRAWIIYWGPEDWGLVNHKIHEIG